MTTFDPLAELKRLDAVIAATPRGRRSLCPERAEATPLALLAAAHAGAERPDAWDQLARVAAAGLENFPENIFWDFDYLVHALLQLETPERERFTQLVVALNRRFGRHTVIAFRYAHDFLYGYDWARWVKKSPEQRSGLGPFSMEFLASMNTRGKELEALIDENDAKYPRLPAGEARNPFSFSREPEDEALLFIELAARGAIPVPAWQTAVELDYSRAYTQIREQTAAQLGLINPNSASQPSSA
ncbi:MAG TPA: ferrochelatase [Polyangiaceae bacterium]|nr:ferrochelatase [Polyangiaceae bacterium]